MIRKSGAVPQACLAAAAVILFIAFCALGTENVGSAPVVILGALVLVLGLSVVSMTLTLRRSLRTAFYTYGNIALIGSILFCTVLFLVLLKRLIACIHADSLPLPFLFRDLLGFPRHFSYYAVFVLMALCVLLGVSNVALIRHEGFCLHNALSIVVAALYIGGTLLIYLAADLLEKYVFIPQGISRNAVFLALNTVIPLFLLMMLCYFECILVGTAVMGWLAAKRKPAYDKDYIIILGCSIDKRGGLLPLLKGRVNKAIRFAWDQEIATGRPVKYVPSGGQDPNEIMSEGSAMELYLKTRGAEDYEVFPEKQSRNTWENFCCSKKIVEELNPNARVAFATTNYHILRSGILARKAGLDAEGVAGDTKWYFWPNGFVREFFGILALNVRIHIVVAVATALVCAALGCVGYFGNLF